MLTPYRKGTATFTQYAVQQAMGHPATLDAAIETTMQALPENALSAQANAIVVLLMQL
jgi:hypothetical protein